MKAIMDTANKAEAEAFGAAIFESYERAFNESQHNPSTRAAWDLFIDVVINTNTDEYTAALLLHEALQQNVRPRPTLLETLSFVSGQLQCIKEYK
ncbi:MAG: hypothetical protein ACYCSN_13910 [Acidobacteriaceae bacterium]